MMQSIFHNRMQIKLWITSNILFPSMYPLTWIGFLQSSQKYFFSLLMYYNNNILSWYFYHSIIRKICIPIPPALCALFEPKLLPNSCGLYWSSSKALPLSSSDRTEVYKSSSRFSFLPCQYFLTQPWVKSLWILIEINTKLNRIFGRNSFYFELCKLWFLFILPIVNGLVIRSSIQDSAKFMYCFYMNIFIYIYICVNINII